MLADVITVSMNDTPTPINEKNIYDQLILYRNPADVKNVFVGSTNAVSSGAHGARELRGDISRQWNNPGSGAGNARTSTPQPPASSPRPGLTQQNFRS